MILGVVLPIVHVNVWQTGDEEFELLFVEDGDELGRNDVVETWESSASLFVSEGDCVHTLQELI